MKLVLLQQNRRLIYVFFCLDINHPGTRFYDKQCRIQNKNKYQLRTEMMLPYNNVLFIRRMTMNSFAGIDTVMNESVISIFCL
jgi:hypothetical protein